MTNNKKTFRQESAPETDKELPLPRKARSPLLLEKIRPPASRLRPKDTRPIGAALVRDARVPSVFWSAGWVLREIEDTCWLTITEQSFPRRLRPDHKGHPGYVLEEVDIYALRLCPCSSLPQRCPSIPRGAVLQPTGFVNDRETFVIEGCASVIPRDDAIFSQIPAFLGIFPPEKLQR